MCGIIGYTDSNISALKQAHKLQCHRGPDDSGFYNDDYISLGHNRLSIIDLNERSAQPMWDSSGRYCIVFNGEIYNYQELRNELKKSYTFKTESDTEVLLALYRQYGHRLTEHIHGMYAFAVYDTQTKDMTLFRDQFGIKPLYYAFVNNTLFFTSELKAMVSLFGSHNTPLELDHKSISVYLTLGYTISPNTIYTNIKLLLPGTILKFNAKKSNSIEILKTPLPQPKNLSETEYMDLIEEKILSNLVADVPVGVFFSGGTDSSLITAVLHKHGIDLETFSVKVDGRDADEYYFKKISEELKLKNTTYVFDTEAFDSIYQEVVNKLDNPSGSNGIFQTYFISKKAKEKVKVVLIGDGGDEFFLGYPRSFPLYTMPESNLKKGIWLEKVYFSLPQFYAKNFIFLKLSEFFQYPISYYLNQMSVAREFASSENWNICREKILQRGISPKNFDTELYLSDNLLFKSDASTSYCSIEGRVPFLDIDILSNSYSSAEQSINNKTLKWFPKKMLSKYLPVELVYRKKSGFGVNYNGISKQSDYIHSDFKKALLFLKEIYPSLKLKPTKNGQFQLIVICLYHSLRNNKTIYEDRFSNK